ncbi:hypothetical protein ACX6XY_13750 [Streptomyces sp. O3]
MSASTLVREPGTAVEPAEEKTVSAFTSASINAYTAATTAPARAAHSIQAKIDKGLVRYDGWFLAFTAVILALGATIIAGLSVWCVVKQNKTFSGSWSFRNFGLKVRFECV